MKQKVAVRAIIRQGSKTLLLKRANGRQSILGKYELPGGKLDYGEQPEDGLRRYVKQDAGLAIQTMHLYDVITYVDHDDRDIQYTFLLYTVTVVAKSTPTLSDNYSKYLWWAANATHQDELTESSKLLLGIMGQVITSAKVGEVIGDNDNDLEPDEHVIIYSDGGSRGNPGPSASGFVMMNANGDVIHQGGLYLGVTTNNLAEYHGVRLGLEKALSLGIKSIDFRVDSLLVVNQLNGQYSVKNRELRPIHDRVKDLVQQFDQVTFHHVRREYNQLADGMVNKILNAHAEQNGV